jgi:hypothetical protein
VSSKSNHLRLVLVALRLFEKHVVIAGGVERWVEIDEIDLSPEFPSLDTEQSRFVYQKAGSLAFAQSLLVPAPPG